MNEHSHARTTYERKIRCAIIYTITLSSKIQEIFCLYESCLANNSDKKKKPAFARDADPLPSASKPHNIFPNDSS